MSETRSGAEQFAIVAAALAVGVLSAAIVTATVIGLIALARVAL